MGIIASAGNTSETKEYQRLDTDTYPARCVQIIDIGTHISDKFKYDKGDRAGEFVESRKVYIVWEISELTEDGKPFMVAKEYTLSLQERANLYKDLVKWRDKPFTAAQLQAFELKNILNAPCLLSVAKVPSKDGTKFYNNVTGIAPIGKRFEAMERVTDLLEFSIDEIHTEKYEALSDYYKKKIQLSEEYKRAGDFTPTLLEDDDTPAF